MSKSAKRKAHDARKAEMLEAHRSELAVMDAEFEKLLQQEAPPECNCENAACAHVPGECSNPAPRWGTKIVDLGSVCSDCYETYPESCRVLHRMRHRFGGWED